jgi:YaiO family outer membrane protein
MTKRRSNIITIAYILLSGVFSAAWGQDMQELNYEQLHQGAKEAILNEDFNSAKDFYEFILKKFPEDADALLALGRLEAWQENFSKAEELLFLAVRLYPDYADIWQALGDVYFWQQKNELALNAYIEWGKREPLQWEPSIKKAKAEINLRRNNAARQSIESARMLGAPKEEWEMILKSIQQNQGVGAWQCHLIYEQTSFDLLSMESWHRWAAGIQHRKGNWTKIAELQRVERYADDDYSLAWDNYFTLKKSAYFNLRAQAAFRQTLLPILDLNAEYYQGLGGLFELSAGYRLMHFTNTNAHLLSLGAAAYLNNEFLRLRFTEIMQKGSEPDLMLLAAWRHYFVSADHWLELYSIFSNIEDNMSLQDKIKTVGLKGETYISKKIGLQAGLSRSWERADTAQWGFSLGLSCRW